MSQHYGQSITYGVLGAPALFTGDKMSFSYRRAVTKDNLEDGASDFTAMALHSRKAEINFAGEVTSGSTDFLDLSGGQKLTLTGGPAGIDLAQGMILAEQTVEEWGLLRRKQASVKAWHYPDATDESGPAAGTTPIFDSQDLAGLLFPGGTLNYSTVGITHAAGVVHNVRLTQTVQITDDEPSPDGKLLGAFTHGYERMLSLTLLQKPADAAIPAEKSVLAFLDAPDRIKNFRVISASPAMERKRGLMFTIEAAWIPPFGA